MQIIDFWVLSWMERTRRGGGLPFELYLCFGGGTRECESNSNLSSSLQVGRR